MDLRSPLQIDDDHITFGEPFVTFPSNDEQIAAFAFTGVALAPAPIPVAAHDLSAILGELILVRQEVKGLRSDLASRTLAARARRFLVWLRSLW